jgi:anthranilate phosphoribosyltransferase
MKRVDEMLSEMRAVGGLGEAAVVAAAELLLDGGVGDDEKAELLTALSEKGETAEEIAGFVRVFLGHAVRVPLELEGLDRPALDVCGTGGDKLDLFNVSTASMFVLAGGGAAVVKHGNRGITSKSGGADVLEALGVRIDLAPERFAESVRRHGAGFMLAPQYHPAFKAVAGVRRRLAAAGVRTVFNVIGPLLNPLQPPYQLVGVYDGSLPPVYADILGRLGRKRAWVVHGRTADGRGMDEVSTLGVTEVVAVEGGRLTATTLGGPEHPARGEELVGGDAAHNAALLEGILTGKDRGPRREIVVMNAAAAFQVAGLETTWEGGRARAEEAIDSGRAARVLAALREFA